TRPDCMKLSTTAPPQRSKRPTLTPRRPRPPNHGTKPRALHRRSVGYETADSPEGEAILDVRHTGEHQSSHIDGAVNTPLQELLARLDGVPPGRRWVHCGSGYRAGVGASLLKREGCEVVQIVGSFDDAAGACLPMAR
ncbi:rhodanese-like domain-containing protein, partial [Brachybacterium sp. ACRRE]|uniref:rhodanese-like domain-containing protein n=1 Tax=Brachybacterium sp. ACRRE TaxID=2918184 RepID=UPI001EF1CB69